MVNNVFLLLLISNCSIFFIKMGKTLRWKAMDNKRIQWCFCSLDKIVDGFWTPDVFLWEQIAFSGPFAPDVSPSFHKRTHLHACTRSGHCLCVLSTWKAGAVFIKPKSHWSASLLQMGKSPVSWHGPCYHKKTQGQKYERIVDIFLIYFEDLTWIIFLQSYSMLLIYLLEGMDTVQYFKLWI